MSCIVTTRGREVLRWKGRGQRVKRTADRTEHLGNILDVSFNSGTENKNKTNSSPDAQLLLHLGSSKGVFLPPYPHNNGGIQMTPEDRMRRAKRAFIPERMVASASTSMASQKAGETPTTYTCTKALNLPIEARQEVWDILEGNMRPR
jgi:hypothetical protein